MGSMVLISSCSDKSVPKQSEQTLKEDIPSEVATEVFDKAPITNENVPTLQDEEDCHGKRSVTQTLEEANGSIIKVAGMYVISMNEGTDRYQPCELPKKYNQECILVRFSGEVLEIFPNERRAATPFRLKFIAERDE